MDPGADQHHDRAAALYGRHDLLGILLPQRDIHERDPGSQPGIDERLPETLCHRLVGTTV